MADTIGFVGIGNMGAPMATRLLEAGHELVVFDAYDDALSGFATKVLLRRHLLQMLPIRRTSF